MIPLDILSDPICPWCYIGKRRLDHALAQTGRRPFAIRWRMFRLNPDMPPEGMDRQEYLVAKFGGARNAAEVYGAVAQAAEATGLALALDRIARTPDTTDAHRLIRWAEAMGGTARGAAAGGGAAGEGAAGGAADTVAEALFRRYFEDGEDISDHGVLADTAAEAGMDRAVVARLLAGDADRAELIAEETAAREIGVSGVPCFVIAGRHVLSGAQDSATWVRVIRELEAALAGRADRASGTGDAP